MSAEAADSFAHHSSLITHHSSLITHHSVLTMCSRVVARYVMWNTAGTATQLLVGFVWVPVFLYHLGHTVYVLWISLALSFPLGVFSGTLWARQRFDLQNAVDIPTVLVRAGLTFWLIDGPGDLAQLAWLTLWTSLANGLVKALVSFRIDRQLRFRWSL